MSQTSIVNRALTYLGATRITSLSDDTTEAKCASSIYDDSLKSILGESLWGFATKRATLNMLAENPVWGDGHYFQIPADCVHIFGYNENIPHRIEGDRILANTESLGIIYTYLCTDTSKFPSWFVDAFVVKLAYDMCFELTNSDNRAGEFLQLYKTELLPLAKSKNAQDNTPYAITDDFWVKSTLSARWG
jgi:hypothetical protein